MKKKTETVLAIEHSKRVCDQQPEFVDRMEVRRLVVNAYRSGYRKGRSEHIECIAKIEQLNLADVDTPVFTHTKDFRKHFDFIMNKINDILRQTQSFK